MSGISKGKGESLHARHRNSLVRGMEERLWVELGDTPEAGTKLGSGKR